MSRLTLFRVGFLFLILFFTTTAKAQKEAETFNVDSTLYEYYQRCQECLLEPVVLNMSDTLFRMAGERQDERMQAVAIATQLDYYYFQGTNEDSVIHYTNKVKEFAKATHQPKYYYFAWANRLITYYLKTSRTNIALYEVQNMLKRIVRVKVKKVTKDGTTRFKTTVYPARLGQTVIWKSSNPAIASINNKGKVSVKKSGIVKFTVQKAGKKVSVKLNTEDM